ncbi:MAG TPA: hypothetical protein PLY36_00565 [Spirochaetota bacterium]|nr:hypothetical protein [Spirochaetota bacterium]
MNRTKIKEKNLFIGKDEHVSFSAGEFKIRCIKGVIWVTWPWSGDVILKAGDEISLRAEGTLCMNAFTGSLVEINKREIFTCVKDIPRLMLKKTFRAVLIYIKNGEKNSVFGDSVHSITR